MNWTITSHPSAKTEHKPAIGPREHVKAVINARADIPVTARAALCAAVDSLPAAVSAVSVDANCVASPKGKIIGNYTVTALY